VEAPSIERGEGAYVWDSNGKEYLDGLVNFDEIEETLGALMEADLGT
jgi:acetylornithine/succinyldiaminopimelate/putrescine aminotransferase